MDSTSSRDQHEASSPDNSWGHPDQIRSMSIPSLNSSLTAAWNVTPVASSSTPTAQSPSNPSVPPAQKRRIRRNLPLNTPSGPSTPDANTPTEDRPPTPPRRKRPRGDAGAAGSVAAKYAPPDLDLESLGGVAPQKAALQEAVVLPLLYPDVFAYSGHQRPCGVLLHGVPGGGKTHLVKCLAGVSARLRAGPDDAELC